MPEEKLCSRCHQHPRHPYQPWCDQCIHEYNIQYRKDHSKELRNKARAKYAELSPEAKACYLQRSSDSYKRMKADPERYEKAKERSRRYYHEHKEQRKEYAAEWRKRHPSYSRWWYYAHKQESGND